MRSALALVAALLGGTACATTHAHARQGEQVAARKGWRPDAPVGVRVVASSGARLQVRRPGRLTADLRPARLQGDPADSLYRVAREALNRGDNRRCAELFEQIWRTYPRSAHAPDALYWQAFALYRIGNALSLRAALEALTAQQNRYPQAAARGDAAVLAARIRGELARRGDAKSAARVATDAKSRSDSCPGEDEDIRVAALNALMQINPERAVPILRQVLARRDACSVPLREKAVFIVAQQVTPETADILLRVAQTDPDRGVRVAAVQWLSEVPGDQAVLTLDSILRTSSDKAVQEKAIFALAEHESARASQVLRKLVARPDVPDHLKREAIFALGHYSGEAGDAAFLRDVYPRLASPELKETLIQSVAQLEDEATRRWLLDLARQKGEPVEARKQALFWAGEAEAPVAGLTALYDGLSDREMKEHLIFVLSEQEDPAATDKLLEIARKEPDLGLRKKAIFWLSEKDDPRVQQLLLEILKQ
jgi:HEAT repeat protein